MKMSLSKALKEKNRLVGKLSQKLAILTQENSKVKGSERTFDLHVVFDEMMTLHKKVVQIKQIAAAANAPIAGKLSELSELKGMIGMIKRIDTKVGITQSHGPFSDDSKHEYEAVLTAPFLLQQTEELEGKVEQLQDEIDEFNAKTVVEIPD